MTVIGLRRNRDGSPGEIETKRAHLFPRRNGESFVWCGERIELYHRSRS
jgi:hypothetical protein